MGFSSLRARDAQSAILNLEQGDRVTYWGRLIFGVTDVDALWTHLKEKGFDPEIPKSGENCVCMCSKCKPFWKSRFADDFSRGLMEMAEGSGLKF